MSRIRQTKITAPSSPPASTLETYYDTAGPGYNTPAALAAKDENGVILSLGHFTSLDYRLISVRVFTAGTTYTPTAGTRAIYVECQGAGGGGGGCANAATNGAGAGGGGGGAYSASWITGISTTKAYAIGGAGAGGTAGANTGTVGGDTTFDTSTIIAKGGSGGIGDTVAVIHVGGLGGAGGLASSGAGDVKLDGDPGSEGYSLAAAQSSSGNGGSGFMGLGAGQGRKSQGAGNNAGNYGAGGGGACILSGGASVAGGNGGIGVIRIWEFA